MSDETYRNCEHPHDAGRPIEGGDASQPVPAISDSEPETTNGAGSRTADPLGNLDDLRLSQDFAAQAAVRPVFTMIPVRKPNRQEFVRVRPGDEWRFETGTFKDDDSGEFYMVSPQLWYELPGEVKPTCLTTCISRNSPVPFLWPIMLPGPDGRPNRWHESAAEAARHAERDWLRVVADMSAGCYVPHVAAGNLAEPEWPEKLKMGDLIRLAFRDRFINDVDHPALRRLRGEA
jgi:hypothetical protein